MDKKKDNLVLFITSLICILFMLSYFVLCFINFISYNGNNFNMFTLAFPNVVGVNTHHIIAVSVVFSVIAVIVTIFLPLITNLMNINRRNMLLVSCLTLPLLSFNLAVNFLIVPIFKNANGYPSNVNVNYLIIIAQCILLTLTILSIIFSIFYLAIKQSKHIAFKRKKEDKNNL